MSGNVPGGLGNLFKQWAGGLSVTDIVDNNLFAATAAGIVIGNNGIAPPPISVLGTATVIGNIVVDNPSGKVTGVTVSNDNINLAEMLVQTTGTGDAQYRVVALGVLNWAFGIQRTTGHFRMAPATTLSNATVFDLDLAGNLILGNASTSLSLQVSAGAAGAATLSLQGSANSFGTGDLLIQQDAGNNAFFNNNSAASTTFKVNGHTLLQLGSAGSSAVGFFGSAPTIKPTITGSKSANAALASLLTALASFGLVTDSTT